MPLPPSWDRLPRDTLRADIDADPIVVRLGTFDQFDGAECTKTLYTGYQVVRIAQLVHRCCADFRAPLRSGGVEGYLRRRREAG